MMGKKMKLSSRRYSARVALALTLLALCGHTAGDSVRGALAVSVMVLPSCEVRADGGAANAIAGRANQGPREVAVACPPAHPFRATLSYRTATGPIESSMEAGLVFTGSQRVDLSRLPGAVDRGAEREVTALTISY